MVDVLIQTYNEALNLPYTLASLEGLTNRVFVVDSGSTDGTQRIAESMGATVVHHDWEGYARQKNWAIDNLPFESEWILILDADESLTLELKEEIRAVTSRDPKLVPEVAFHINRVLIFLGRKIWNCGYYPSWNMRLFRRGKARYEDRAVHEHMIPDGKAGYLKHLLLHEDRRGLEHFFAKHNRYSTLEAWEIYARPEPWPGWHNFINDRVARRRFGKTRVLPLVPAPWMVRFVFMYLFRWGFLDGRAGWLLCNFIASYELSVQLKLRELRRLRASGVSSIAGLKLAEGQLNDLWVKRDGTALPMLPRTENVVHPDTLPPPLLEDSPFRSPWTLKQNIGRALWMVTSAVLFRLSFHNWYAWRRLLLRIFGARIGSGVRVRPSVKIEIPWNLTIDDQAVVGDDAILYCLGPIYIGRRVVISQYAHLCAGTHDFDDPSFPLIKPPISVGDNCWIAADVFVGPDVRIGKGTVVGARSSVFKSLPENVIAVGNPAKVIRHRFDKSTTHTIAATSDIPESVPQL